MYLPSIQDMEAYIRQAASLRGIDPNIAVAVAKSEGLKSGAWQSDYRKNGVREPSYGPFQLYKGGGLGNEYQDKTGLDPEDPSNWQKQVDFSLDKAKSGGWSPWYGAKNTGIGEWEGIKPTDITSESAAPTGEPMNIEEELARLRKQTEDAGRVRPHPSDVLMGIGSTLSSLGSGGRVANQAPEIIAAGRRNAQAEYERKLVADQHEQALRYIAKTGNPELLSAYQAGMDPGEIIKMKMGHQYDMEKIGETQRLQALYDPSLIKQKQTEAENASFIKNFFSDIPGQGGGQGGVESAGLTTPIPGGQPPPAADTGPIPTFAPQAQTQEVPTVDSNTTYWRRKLTNPDITPSDAQGLSIAIQKGSTDFLKEFNEMNGRILRRAEINKPQIASEGSAVIKDGKIQLTVPKTQEVPNEIRVAEYLKNHPELSPTYMEMKRAGSNVQTPSQAALTETYKTIAEKTVPKLIDRGRIIATSSPQINSLEKLIETVPAGMTMDAWVAQNVPGYSGQADAFKSIVLNLAPQTKVEGSGSQSDVEYAGALAQFPKIMGTREGNRAVLSIIRAKNKVEIDAARAASQYVKDGDMVKFVDKLDEINSRSILADVPQSVKDLIQSEASKQGEEESNKSSVTKSATDAGFDQSDWDVMTPEERAKFQ